jgi:hypothetical protein
MRSSTKAEDSGGGGSSRSLRGVWEPAWWCHLRPRGYAEAILLQRICNTQHHLPELDAFGGDFDVMWRGFVTSVIAAVTLQYVDPFRTSKLVLFQVCLPFLYLPNQVTVHTRRQPAEATLGWLLNLYVQTSDM